MSKTRQDEPAWVVTNGRGTIIAGPFDKYEDAQRWVNNHRVPCGCGSPNCPTPLIPMYSHITLA